ncbi:MAG: hypothetical protein AAGI24_08795 [Pseudomonadota bacterium]
MTAVVKIIGLIVYGFMAWVAITKPLTLGANFSTGLLVVLALVHLIECWMFRETIAKAPGSRAWHLLNVFLYGVFHMMLIRRELDDELESLQEFEESAS